MTLCVVCLGIKAVAHDLVAQATEVEIQCDGVVHLVGHIEPSHFLTLRTVGEHMEHLALDAVAADAVYLVDERVAGLELPHSVARHPHAQCLELFGARFLVESTHLHVAEAVVHQFR